jgi:hypothetical protein
MARSQARIGSGIWSDPDWCALSVGAQHAYFMLLTQPKLTLAGCLDWMPQRWNKLVVGADSAAHIEELIGARFVVAHDDELVIRTFVRNDVCAGALNRNLVKGMWSAWASITSPLLRKVVVDNMPAALWAFEAAQPPDQAIELRSEPQLQLPLEPRSEPSVDLYPLPPTSTADGCPPPSAVPTEVANPAPSMGEDEAKQKLYEAAALIGRKIAADKSADDVRSYGATVTRDLLQGPDSTDRRAIAARIAAGEEPDQIAASWVLADPLTGTLTGTPAADPAAIEAARRAAARREAASAELIAQIRTAPRGTPGAAAAARAALQATPSQEDL